MSGSEPSLSGASSQLERDFRKKGDVYEATPDVEVSYLTSWSAPFTGGGTGTLNRGERVMIENAFLARPISVNGTPIDYARVEERLIAQRERSNPKYDGFRLSLRPMQDSVECAPWQFVLLLSNGQKNHSVQQPQGDEVGRISLVATSAGKRTDSRCNGPQP